MDKPTPIDISQAKCTKLSFCSPVHLLRSTETKELTGFDIEAYTGAVVDRWWGKLVVAVDGIAASQQMPIFRNHDHAEIVGYSTSCKNDGTFSVQGVFSAATEAAAEVKALAAEGFPWQASIGVRPKTVLDIRENAAMVVNGQTVQGPAEVWLESEVFETSFVPLGADGNTRVSVFTEQVQKRAVSPTTHQEQKTMDLEQLKKDHPGLVVALSAEIVAGLTVEALRQEHPELVTAITTEGANLERERIKDVRAQLIPGHEALVASLELDGTSTGADAAKAIIAGEKLLRQKAGQLLDQQANQPVLAGGDPNASGAATTMKRADFAALSLVEQGRVVKSGTKIVD